MNSQRNYRVQIDKQLQLQCDQLRDQLQSQGIMLKEQLEQRFSAIRQECTSHKQDSAEMDSPDGNSQQGMTPRITSPGTRTMSDPTTAPQSAAESAESKQFRQIREDLPEKINELEMLEKRHSRASRSLKKGLKVKIRLKEKEIVKDQAMMKDVLFSNPLFEKDVSLADEQQTPKQTGCSITLGVTRLPDSTRTDKSLLAFKRHAVRRTSD